MDGVKRDVRATYARIQNTFRAKIEHDEKVFQQWINQFYFPHLAGKTNVPLLSQLAEGNFQQLPSKGIIKLTKAISNRKKTSIDSTQIADPLE